MATDATGTPTSLGIPTLNVGVDAPTGNGENNMMAAIDTLIAARVASTLLTTTGDMIYASGVSTPARLGIGSNGSVMTVAAGVPSWSAGGGLPSGIIVQFAGASAPSGWLICDASAISRTGTNAALFAAIGTTYGVGDGSTTFNVPDGRGRALFGLGAHADMNALANSDGGANSARSAIHNHTTGVAWGDPAGPIGYTSGASGGNQDGSGGTSTFVKNLPTVTAGLTGRLQDKVGYLIVNHIIKL